MPAVRVNVKAVHGSEALGVRLHASQTLMQVLDFWLRKQLCADSCPDASKEHSMLDQ